MVSAFSFSLTPYLISQKVLDGYPNFLGLLFQYVLLFSIIVLAFGILTSSNVVDFYGENYLRKDLDDAVVIARIAWITAILSILIGLFTSIYNANEKYIMPIFFSLIPVLSSIFFGVLGREEYGIVSFSFGAAVGSFISVATLFVTLFNKICYRNCLKFTKEINYFIARIHLVFISLLAFTIYQAIDSYWAPLTGVGNLTYLSYSQRLLIGIGSLIIAGPSVILGPRLAKAYVDNRIEVYYSELKLSIKIILLCVVPVAIVLIIFTIPSIELVFERGEFSKFDTVEMSNLLPFMIVGMVAMVNVVILFRALFAKDNYKIPAILGATCAISYFLLSGIFSNLFGGVGIALAYALTWWLVFFVTLWLTFHGQFDQNDLYNTSVFFVKLVIVCSLTGIIVYGLSLFFIKPMIDVGWLILFINSSMIVIFGSVVYFFIGIRILNFEEMIFLYNSILKKVYK